MKKVLQVNREPIEEDQIIWQGSPCFIPYVLLHSGIAGMVPVTFLVWYRFINFLPQVAYAWTVFFVLCIISGAISCMLTHYYITRSELIVKKGPNFYRIKQSDILEADYYLYSRRLEGIFGCRSIRYGQRRKEPGRGSSMALWRKGAIFLCLHEYDTPNELIQEILRRNRTLMRKVEAP
jgi:hypothetical protein